jgi:hypothetical protein
MIGKRKFFKVYSGPGYPIDPKLEEERLHPEPEPPSKPKTDVVHRKAFGHPVLPKWLFAQRN